MIYPMRADQELPSIPLLWEEITGYDPVTGAPTYAPIDFSTGWTLSVKAALLTTPDVVALTKNTGITGAATIPNILIGFAAAELTSLATGKPYTDYVLHVYARRNADSKDRVFSTDDPPILRLYPAPA